jgi:hypothetical protein
VLSVVLSLLLPGLGHVYVGKLGRGLIWLVGALVVGFILGGQNEDVALAFALLAALSVFAAADVVLLLRLEGAQRRH